MKKVLFIILIIILLFLGYLFIGKAPVADNIVWGVNFSQKHAFLFGLDWKETYLALVDDLGVKKMKIASYWDLIEGEEGSYNFSDLDWQINKAEEKEVDVLLVIGMKSPRWPECHIPEWAKGLEKEQQQEKILDYLKEIVLRYQDFSAISAWQIENEPFFPFGDCPWVDNKFLKQEIELVKSLDSRPIVISDSGEGSFWLGAASYGDIVGTTIYRKVWFRQLNSYISYPLPSVFYYRKALLVNKLYGKDVICVELQTEPWGPELLYSSPLGEQEKTMNLEQFRKNIEYAKNTGLAEFHLWGAEWWYWMKEVQGDASIWQEAKKLF